MGVVDERQARLDVFPHGNGSAFDAKRLSVLRSRSSSLVAIAAATYSASAVDVTTVDWRLLAHETGPPLRVKMKPVVD